MEKMTVLILGTEYVVEKKAYSEEPEFEERDIDGYCDGIAKRIVICDISTRKEFENESANYVKTCENEILRHEIIHAFLNESGLTTNAAQFTGAWPQNEEMVDWIALQFPKILAVYRQLGVI